jgi:hypothetical protein
MALKFKGGVLFDDSSGQDVVFEGAFPGDSVVTQEAVLEALGVSALGTEGQVLVVNGDEDGLEFGDADGVAGVGAAGAAIVALADFGTAGQVLATNAGADDVEWADDATGA